MVMSTAAVRRFCDEKKWIGRGDAKQHAIYSVLTWDILGCNVQDAKRVIADQDRGSPYHIFLLASLSHVRPLRETERSDSIDMSNRFVMWQLFALLELN